MTNNTTNTDPFEWVNPFADNNTELLDVDILNDTEDERVLWSHTIHSLDDINDKKKDIILFMEILQDIWLDVSYTITKDEITILYNWKTTTMSTNDKSVLIPLEKVWLREYYRLKKVYEKKYKKLEKEYYIKYKELEKEYYIKYKELERVCFTLWQKLEKLEDENSALKEINEKLINKLDELGIQKRQRNTWNMDMDMNKQDTFKPWWMNWF